MRQLKDEDPTAYKNVLKISNELLNSLLEMIDEIIHERDTKMRMPISTTKKLYTRLHFLATGDSFKSLEYLFRVPEFIISVFIPEVLAAICKAIYKGKHKFSSLTFYTYKTKLLTYGKCLFHFTNFLK